MSVVTLDLSELADEWQDLLDEIGDNAHPDDYVLEREKCQTFIDLCDELGLTPVEPATLRWYAEKDNPTFVREDTFTEYAQEFAESVHGDGVREMSSYIDWERFANAMRMDYYSLEYDGWTWLRRA